MRRLSTVLLALSALALYLFLVIHNWPEWVVLEEGTVVRDTTTDKCFYVAVVPSPTNVMRHRLISFDGATQNIHAIEMGRLMRRGTIKIVIKKTDPGWREFVTYNSY